jgi:hypothetical protein
VAGLLFVQEFQNWTNAEAVEAYLFRTDIQVALNLEPGVDEMCERTLERYRALFLEDESAGQVMQDVTDRLIDLLELDIAKQRLDSTHVFSNMASFGRTRLMAVTIKRFLTQVKRHHLSDFEALPAELRQRYAPSQAQLLSKESKDADGRAKSRQQVAEDMRDLIDRFADHAGLRDRASYQALVTVFTQQCEIVDDGVQVRSKTGGACVQNPSDLDATYDGKKGQGYQAQFSETCSEANEVQLIVSALPQTAVESDANALEPVLEDLQKREASTVVWPIAVTRTRIGDCKFIVPAATDDPTARATGKDSPVSMASSMRVVPSRITPSVGMVSPLRTHTSSLMAKALTATSSVS